MKSYPWFKFYANDFLGGVAEMTHEERGIYITLLCVQWTNGTLPPDADGMRMACGGGTLSERVLGKFPLRPDGVRRANIRLEEVRADVESKRDLAQNRKNRMKERNRNATGTRSGTLKGTHLERSGSDSDSDSLLPLGKRDIHEPVTPKRRAPGNTGGGYSEDFESFWTAYPRKAGKGAAWRAWRSAKMKPVQETILAAVQAAKGSDQWTRDNGQYIPHPATWINQARWDDVPTIATGQPAATPEKPRGTWDLEKQIELLRSERERLYMSDFQNTGGPERNADRYAKWLEVSNKMRDLQAQIAGKA